MEKNNSNKRKILLEDVEDLEKLVVFYVKKGNFDKVRSCEFELEKIRKELRNR